MANSAATKNPLARTSASTAMRRMLTSRTGLSMEPPALMLLERLPFTVNRSPSDGERQTVNGERLAFSAAEEMRVDELVDEALIGRLDLVELQPHAVAAIAPRDSSFGVDVALRSGKAEPDSNPGAVVERAGRADCDAATAQVQRERRGN